MTRHLQIGMVVACLVGSCGSGDHQVACTGSDDYPDECIEYSTPDGKLAQAFAESCPAHGGTVSTTCSHSGAIGGCRFNLNVMGVEKGTSTYWQYSGDAAAQKASCESGGATWITP